MKLELKKLAYLLERVLKRVRAADGLRRKTCTVVEDIFPSVFLRNSPFKELVYLQSIRVIRFVCFA